MVQTEGFSNEPDSKREVLSLLNYYQRNRFNPVPISVEERSIWEEHFAKRLNLYQRHLMIPFALLHNRSILEFGCNSGENSLVFAAVGADLTLVEPNSDVWPRLQQLFRKFDLEERIVEKSDKGIGDFESQKSYDLVIAEGFLFTLPKRDEMVRKIVGFLNPGGMGIISFNDRYGSLIEMTKKLLLYRACQLKGVTDIHGEDSLALAKLFFLQDYAKINASRPFEVWWKDVLVNPFLSWDFLWSYQEIIRLVEGMGCEFYSSSPRWATSEYHTWYKNVAHRENRHRAVLEDWAANLPYFLTGINPLNRTMNVPSGDIIGAIGELVARISHFFQSPSSDPIRYPSLLKDYLDEIQDTRISIFNAEMERLFEKLGSHELEALISAYCDTEFVRKLWGTPYHYICFNKSSHEF